MMADLLALEVLCFRLGGILWGIEAEQIDRIVRSDEGAEHPLLDPRRLLGVAPLESAASRRLLLRRGSARAVLPVDEVLDLLSLSPDKLAAIPPLIAGALADDRIWGVGKVGDAVLLLLDPATLCGRALGAGEMAGREEG